MDNTIFGRYTNYDTPIHRIEPRVKIILMIILIVPVFFKFTNWYTNMIMVAILLIFFFLITALSRTKIRTLLRSLSTMWFLILFLLVVYLFVPNSSYHIVMVQFSGGYTLYWDSVYQCFYIIIRLFLIVAIAMMLTCTTKNTDLTYAFEWYMAPLKVVHFPSHAIAMTLSIALRFIPTLLEESSRILKAQESRGIDFSHGGFGRRFRAIIALIIPLFNSAFSRSDELAHAMEARGYDPNAKRTRYRKYPLHSVDLYATLIILAFFGLFLALYIIDRNNPIDIINLLSGVETNSIFIVEAVEEVL
ncbi:MAG: energy-coupling factor transporter transmembrane protein EcfT [Coprobacillus sp.]|nr:energy-coupling factor transporter transmembrane protein EcfT [Coprobacillus sp.]